MAISGKSGFITYNATNICIEKWSVSTTTPVIDTTNSCTLGQQDNVGGPFSGTITASGPVLSSGTVLPTVGSTVVFSLGYNTGSPVVIASFSAVVQSIRNNLDVSGRYEFEITAQSTNA